MAAVLRAFAVQASFRAFVLLKRHGRGRNAMVSWRQSFGCNVFAIPWLVSRIAACSFCALSMDSTPNRSFSFPRRSRSVADLASADAQTSTLPHAATKSLSQARRALLALA